MKKQKNIIRILDVTNRDGVQTSKLGLAKLQKTMINIYLNDIGVYQNDDQPCLRRADTVIVYLKFIGRSKR